jgi:hypothetical protein
VAKQKSPPRIWYQQSRIAISRFLTSNRRDYGVIDEARSKLQAIVDGTSRIHKMATDFTINNAELSMEALKEFVSLMDRITIGGFNFSLPSGLPNRLLIERVTVSIHRQGSFPRADRRWYDHVL